MCVCVCVCECVCVCVCVCVSNICKSAPAKTPKTAIWLWEATEAHVRLQSFYQAILGPPHSVSNTKCLLKGNRNCTDGWLQQYGLLTTTCTFQSNWLGCQGEMVDSMYSAWK